MTRRVLIIGGYGNFGSFIARRLAQDDNIQLIIAGRSLASAQSFVTSLYARQDVEAAQLDINDGLSASLALLNPEIVIHTSGPFQSQGYEVASACIERGCHYIDLADGREFVAGIVELDQKARDKGVLVVSGASSVPCLTSALVDHYQTMFETIEHLDYGITTAQKTNRGLATTTAILGYVGKPFTTLQNGSMTTVYGWQDLHSRHYRGLGRRMLGNCDVPDLALFPERYPGLRSLRFCAGLEIPFIHIGLWGLSGLVRAGIISNLTRFAPALLRLAMLFDWAGSANSGFHMVITGKDRTGSEQRLNFELIAKGGDGPYIPCTPAILIASRLASGELTQTGATPCVGLISQDDYLNALADLDISWMESWLAAE